MRNNFQKFLTSEYPPLGNKGIFAKTWKYAACMLLALTLGFGQMWGATSAAAGTYKTAKPSAGGKALDMSEESNTVFVYRPNTGGNSSFSNGIKTTDNANGVAFYISTSMKFYATLNQKKESKNKSCDVKVYQITESLLNTIAGATSSALSSDPSGLTTTELTDYKKTVSYSSNAAADPINSTEVTLPAGYYYVLAVESDGNAMYWYSITLSAAAVTKHTVTYKLNGATGTTPIQADVAEGGKFTLHNGTTDITAPSGQKFDGWHDGATKYAGGAEYTMGTSNVTLTAQWVENVPDPTASFADATYIIGQSALDMSAMFTSNSTGAVTYALKEATANASITAAGAFTATAAGTYVVVASQEAVAGTYSAITKEATVTVLDNELSDTYIWKKNADYTGCVANPNAEAPAALYTTVSYDGFTGMGRATADNTECILTFTVLPAYASDFGIKSICTYGKFEEPLGGQISWDGGANWEDLAAYKTEQAKTFNAPATFPTSFKIKFLGVNKGSGGLWWRNALVTLEVKKTVSGITEALQNVKVNDAAISASDLTSLQTNKTLNIATTYAAAPTVTFVKRTTTNYLGGWPASVVDTEEDVVASDATTNWSATSSAINAQTYTVTLAKPAGPTLETTVTSFTLTSAKIATAQEQFTFSGANLSGNVTISLESAVTGMTVSPTEVTPTAGAITDQEVTITYKSLDDVATANVNLIVYYDADTKITIPLTYSSTAGVEDLTPISAATTWNWDHANSSTEEIKSLNANNIVVFANYSGWDESFKANSLAGKLQYVYRGSNYAQGHNLKFNTTIPGKVYVKFSNTGGKDIARAPRITDANGTYAPADESEGSKNTTAMWYNHSVAAGDVLIEGFEMKDPIALNMLRYYEVRFAPVFSVTYDAGEGSVKGGEVIPTQADEAAGEKIILADADVLEKSGYDFNGWLCSVDGVTYDAGAEYTMTAAATTFTAQWVLHVDPVDPTLTYDNGAYMTGGAALDLSTLITASNSTGAITYSVKDAGTTGATIDGNNFTATAAGTAIITASQAAVLGYNAKTVDFNVVVTEAVEIDGVKLVEAGALTGNFRIKADQLKSGSYTVEGINYTKYVQMGSAHTSFSGETEGNQSKGIYYAPAKKNIKFWFYMRNTDSSSRKIYIYKMEEGSAVASATVDVPVGSQLVSYDMTLATNAEVVFGVENTKLYFCQIVAVESGDNLLQAGENGYVFDYSKKRQNVAKETLRTIDGMQYYLSAESKINSASNVQLQTLGTHYIKFHLATPMTVKVTIDGTGKQYYIGSECSTNDEAKIYSATATEEFSLATGDWYINAAVQVKVTKLEFTAPKCAEPVFNGALADIELCAGDPFSTAFDGTATVGDGGIVTYKWYAEGADETDPAAVLGTNATYTPNADGKYYVIATNSLSGFADNSTKSALVNITQFAAAEITTAPLNQRATAGNNVTLSVAATGKNVAYKWYTCDEDGSNEVALDPEQTGTSIEVTITAGLLQWYKVKVTSDCGNAEAMAKVEEFVPATPANVTTSMVWDWTSAAWPASGEVQFTDKTEDDTDLTPAYELLADADAIVPKNAAFRSDMLYGKGQYVWRSGNKFFQGTAIKFTTEVAGLVRVNYRSTGNNKEVQVTIAGTPAGKNKTSNFQWSEYVEVPAGDVEILCLSTDEQKSLTRVQKIEFLAVRHERTLVVGDLGTVCLPNASIARGVTVYEYKGADEIGKIVFDELGANELLVAGKPYIFQVNETHARFYYNTDPAVADPDNSTALKGNLGEAITFQPGSAEAANVYFVKDHAFWMAKNTGVQIGQYRCYLQMDQVQPVSSPNPAPGRRRITLGVQGEQVATDIDQVPSDQVPSTKVIIDGHLYILRGEKMYDAKGQLVK